MIVGAKGLVRGWRCGDDLQPEWPLLIFTVGFRKYVRSPPLFTGRSLLFVSYEICLALSVGLAGSRQQAIEVGMVNYLWPSLTILFAILFNGQKQLVGYSGIISRFIRRHLGIRAVSMV